MSNSTLSSGASVAWIGADPSAPNFATGIAFNNYDPVSKLYKELGNHFLRNRPVVCVGDLTFFPETLPLLQRQQLFFDGACGVQACCFGDRCSTFTETTGGRSSCFAGNYSLSVRSLDGTTKTAKKGFFATRGGRPSYYVYRWRTWRRVNGVWTSASLNQMSVYRAFSWNARGVVNAQRCCQIVGIGFSPPRAPTCSPACPSCSPSSASAPSSRTFRLRPTSRPWPP